MGSARTLTATGRSSRTQSWWDLHKSPRYSTKSTRFLSAGALWRRSWMPEMIRTRWAMASRASRSWGCSWCDCSPINDNIIANSFFKRCFISVWSKSSPSEVHSGPPQLERSFLSAVEASPIKTNGRPTMKKCERRRMEVRVDVYSAKRRLSCGYKRHLLDYNTEVMGTRIDADWSVVDPSGGNDQGALAPLRF